MKTNYQKIIGLAVLGVSLLSRAVNAQVSPCFPPPLGIVAWYQAESNTVDHVNANNGIYHGTASYAGGEVNMAFSFNGSSYVQAADAPQLHFTNNMTAECWINLASYSGSPQEIVSKLTAASAMENAFTISVDASTHKAYFAVEAADYSASTIVYSSTTIPTNQWTHIAATLDSSSVKIYVNGVLSGTTSWTKGIFSGTAPLTIGCTLQAVPTSFFSGKIDEVSLYNRTLSDCDIQSIYLVGPTGKCP